MTLTHNIMNKNKTFVEPFQPKKRKTKSHYSTSPVSSVKKKNRKKKKKHIPEIFLSFLCSLFLFILLVLIGIKFSLMNVSFALQQADKSNFYEELTEEINQELMDLGLGSGISSKDVLQNFVQESEVREDMSAFIEAAYLGETYTIPEKNFKQDIIQRLTDYAQSNNLQIAEVDGQSSLQTFSNDAFDIYTSNVSIPLLPMLGKKIIAVQTYLLIGIIVFAAVLLICIIILSYLVNHWFHRILRYLAISGLGASLMLIVAPLLILNSKEIDNLAITFKPLYNYASTFVHSFFELFIRFGIFTAIVSIGFILISEISRAKTKYHW